MTDTKSYEFSRIFREGWNAAKNLPAGEDLSAPASDAEALNPYSSADERARWAEGFQEALSSPVRSYNTPGGNAWRRSKQK